MWLQYVVAGGDVGVQHVGLRLRLVDSIVLHFDRGPVGFVFGRE
jgi:hypothetical protein